MTPTSQRKKNKSVLPDFTTEESLWNQGFDLIVGIDEVGRGAWAGPVVAGAVVFQKGSQIEGVRDSKQLNKDDRERLAKDIKSQAFLYSVGEASSEEIDKRGILVATKIAMERALDNLEKKPDYLLVDAVRLMWEGVRCQPIIKGDQKSISIAAGSILAKVYRDKLMKDFDEEFVGYDFAGHKGYGTKKHQDVIDEIGLCDIHRKSFKCFKQDDSNLSLF